MRHDLVESPGLTVKLLIHLQYRWHIINQVKMFLFGFPSGSVVSEVSMSDIGFYFNRYWSNADSSIEEMNNSEKQGAIINLTIRVQIKMILSWFLFCSPGVIWKIDCKLLPSFIHYFCDFSIGSQVHRSTLFFPRILLIF